MERLQKVIAHAGICSRRKAEELITSGHVKVNGVVITELGSQVSKNDVIEVDDKKVKKEEPVYFLLNKPKKYVCTTNDEHGRDQVTDLIDCDERIYPVGRLDYDSTGLLILTNDGEFANTLTHPSFHLPKMYHVTIKGILQKKDVYKLQNGVVLDDGQKTLPAKVYTLDTNEQAGKTTLEITIIEGKNRQIRRMVEAIGYTVTKLHRVSIGPIRDDQMPMGSYRRLRPHEIKSLKEFAQKGE